jgi:hypothetical protein
MTEEQDAHLGRILDGLTAKISAKYKQGQKQHGGNLWEKSGLLEEALSEAIDQVIYLSTLIEQRDQRSGAWGASTVPPASSRES